MKFWLHKMRNFPLFLFKSRVGQQMKVMRYAIKLPHVTQVSFLLCWMKLDSITASSNVVLTLSSTDHIMKNMFLKIGQHFMLSPRVSCLLLNIVSQYVHISFQSIPRRPVNPDWPLVIPVTIYLLTRHIISRLSLVGRSTSLLVFNWSFWWLVLYPWT